MRGFDIREWKALDWAGFVSLIALTLIPLINGALKDYPQFASFVPSFVSWTYLPVPLLLIVLGVILFRSLEPRTMREVRRAPEPDEPPATSRPREPEQAFVFYPISYLLDLTAQLPHIECRFYAINFRQEPLSILQFRLSLQVSEGPTLESIPLRNDELKLGAQSAVMVSCRRNLTDAEFRAMPMRTRRDSAAFEMFARAVDTDNRPMTYGPVNSMVIDGSTTAPQEEPQQRTRRTVAPNLAYQSYALDQVISHLRGSGVGKVTAAQLNRLIGDQALRDGVNPIYEPLDFQAIQEALKQFLHEGKLRLEGDNLTLP
jgi:hypothetical protein